MSVRRFRHQSHSLMPFLLCTSYRFGMTQDFGSLPFFIMSCFLLGFCIFFILFCLYCLERRLRTLLALVDSTICVLCDCVFLHANLSSNSITHRIIVIKKNHLNGSRYMPSKNAFNRVRFASSYISFYLLSSSFTVFVIYDLCDAQNEVHLWHFFSCVHTHNDCEWRANSYTYTRINIVWPYSTVGVLGQLMNHEYSE